MLRKQDQDDADPERGHGEADHEQGADHLIDHAVGAQRGDDGQRHRDDRGQHRGVEHQPDRRLDAVADDLGHRLRVVHRLAEVAMQHVAQEHQVLVPDGLIQAQRLAEGGRGLRVVVVPQHGRHRVSRDQVDQEERDQRDPEENRDRLENPPSDEAEAAHRLMLLTTPATTCARPGG